MVFKKIPVFCLVLVLSLCSCSKELSRSKAQSLLNESEAFKSWKPGISVQSQQFAKPACGEFVSKFRAQTTPGVGQFYEAVSLSAKGKQYFANLKGTNEAFNYWCVTGQMCSFSVLVNKQVGEVTGITGSAESERNVEFKLQYEYPEEVLNCMGKFPDAAKATFRMYDNGWRVMKVGYSKPE